MAPNPTPDLCKEQNVPFLYKQASNIHTERGINGLSLFLAERDDRHVDPATVALIREYPATEMPLLPFTEHGKRFTAADWAKYKSAEVGGQGSRALVPCPVLLPSVVASVTVPSAEILAASESDHSVQTSHHLSCKNVQTAQERTSTTSHQKPTRPGVGKKAVVPMNIADEVRAVQVASPAAIAERPGQVERFTAVMPALDFIDELARRKPRIKGLLNSNLVRGTYDKRGTMRTGTYTWTVSYNAPVELAGAA